jgi:hypothetical protein
MIYDERIQVPVLCPIYFGSGRFSHFYDKEQDYIGKIVSDTTIFFWCSLDFYLDMDEGETSRIKVQAIDENNLVLEEYSVERGVVGTFEDEDAYYFGKCDISKPEYTACVRFRILLDDDVIAESWMYEFNPYYDKDIKVIEYSHFENDYDILFHEKVEDVYVPITYKIAVECGFNPDDFESKDANEDFVGQDMFNNIIDSRPYVVEPLTIGDNFGIPNWLSHKMNVISVLSSLKIEGEEFVRVQDSKFELIDKKDGMGTYKIELQTKDEHYIPFKIFDNTFAHEFN